MTPSIKGMTLTVCLIAWLACEGIAVLLRHPVASPVLIYLGWGIFACELLVIMGFFMRAFVFGTILTLWVESMMSFSLKELPIWLQIIDVGLALYVWLLTIAVVGLIMLLIGEYLNRLLPCFRHIPRTRWI